MGSVTIAATYGAGGSVIAPAVAERLGLPLIDRAVPPALAERLDHRLRHTLPEDEVSEGAVSRLLTRALVSTGLFVGVPAAHGVRGVLAEVAHGEEAIRQLADREGAVILGRAAAFVLKGRPDTLHVRLDGPVERRCKQAMQHEGLDHETAARRQEQADRARRAYVEHFYPRAGAWADPRHYHLILDSTVVSLDGCTELIVRAARDLFARVPAVEPPAG
jgi:cytidylate kinase